MVAFLVATVGTSAGATTTEPGVSNDTVATALDIGALPYSHSTFTDEAVDNSDDGDGCYGSESGYSVWYRYAPQADGAVRFATAGSDFDTVLDVFSGDQRELISCNDDGGNGLDSLVTINAVAGETYLIRAAGLEDEHGLLEFAAEEAIPMAATLAVAEEGTIPKAMKRVVVHGVLTCNQDGRARLFFEASQGVGPLATTGRQFKSIRCGEEVPFTVRIPTRGNGRFLPGPTDVEWSGSACVGGSSGGGGVIIIGEPGPAPEPAPEPPPGPGATVGGGSSTVEADEGEDPSCAPLDGTQSVMAFPTTPNTP